MKDQSSFNFSAFRSLLFVFNHGEVKYNSQRKTGSKFAFFLDNQFIKRLLTFILSLALGTLLFGPFGYLLATISFPIEKLFTLLILLLALIEIVLGLYSTVNELYYSTDLEYYLSFPISATTLVAAKLINYLIDSLTANIAALFPFIIGYLIGLHADALLYIQSVLVFIVCTSAVIFISTILLILLMRVSRFAHNKERFTRLFGAFILVVCIAVGVGAQFVSRGMSLTTIDTTLSTFSPLLTALSPISVFTYIMSWPSLFIPLVFSEQIFLSVLGFVLLLLSFALVVFTLFVVAKKYYFEGLFYLLSATQVQTHKLSNAEVKKALHTRSAFKAIMVYDFLNQLRSPAFFNNSILSALLMPVYFAVILGVSFFVNMKNMDFPAVIALIRGIASSLDFASQELLILTIITFAFVFYISIFSLNTQSIAVARDGQNFFFLKSMPIVERHYLLAKFIPTFLLNTIPTLLILLVLCIFCMLPASLIAYLLLLIVFNSILLQLIGLAVGTFSPNLVWKNETQLQKGGKSFVKVLMAELLTLLVLSPQILLLAIPILNTQALMYSPLFVLALIPVSLIELALIAVFVFKFRAKSLARLEG